MRVATRKSIEKPLKNLVRRSKYQKLDADIMKKRIRNPFYASNFYLEQKLSPSSFTLLYADYGSSGTPLPGDTPLDPTLPPIVPAGPVGPALTTD